MNLYREIDSSEIIDNIHLAFREYGIEEFETKFNIEKHIKLHSKRKTKQVIKDSLSSDYSWYAVEDLYKELYPLYKALGLINRGQKVYTDL